MLEPKPYETPAPLGKISATFAIELPVKSGNANTLPAELLALERIRDAVPIVPVVVAAILDELLE